MTAIPSPAGHWRRWLPPLRWLWPVALLLAIWTPEAMHYRIDRSPVGDAIVPDLAAKPADAVLDELSSIDLGELAMLGFTPASAIAAIEDKSIFIEGLTPQRVPVVGQPQDLAVGPPSYQLFTSGMAIERMLVQAYREDRGMRWLDLAIARARGLSDHELNTRHDNRFLWNDHAVANRASALIALWRVVRSDPALRSTHAGWLLSFALRTGRMLAKPSQFTVRTNHGVMQNLALLQLAAAFPSLPEAASWRSTALARLKLQLSFYVSPEGVVLEHSPGYHAMGSMLLAYAVRLVRLNGLPDDPVINRAMAASRTVLAQLMRPDGTVPPIGNTDAGYTHHLPTISAPDTPLRLAPPPGKDATALPAVYPAAGWAVIWSGRDGLRQSQLMTTWARHVGHGHKHADEGALTWWAADKEWLGAIGYWPYGHPLVRLTYGWRSSNAPHAPGEADNGLRQSDLVSQGNQADLHFVDMSRSGAGGMSFRRQILMLGEAGLLVVDFTSESPRGTETIWTLGNGVAIDRQLANASQFLTTPRTDGLRLAVSFASSEALLARLLNGMEDPLGGWTTRRRVPTAVDSIQVTTSERSSATAALFQLTRNEQLADRPLLAKDATPTHWSISLSLDGQPLTVSRTGDVVEVRPVGAVNLDTRSLRLQPPPDNLATQRVALRSAYARAVAEFPPWRDLWPYRIRISKVLLALFVLIEAAWVLHRWRRPMEHVRLKGWGQFSMAVAWGVVAVWIFAKYLVV